MNLLQYIPESSEVEQDLFVVIRYKDLGPVRTFHFPLAIPEGAEPLSFIWTQLNREDGEEHWIDKKPLRSMCVGDLIYLFYPTRLSVYRVATVGFDLLSLQ